MTTYDELVAAGVIKKPEGTEWDAKMEKVYAQQEEYQRTHDSEGNLIETSSPSGSLHSFPVNSRVFIIGSLIIVGIVAIFLFKK